MGTNSGRRPAATPPPALAPRGDKPERPRGEAAAPASVPQPLCVTERLRGEAPVDVLPVPLPPPQLLPLPGAPQVPRGDAPAEPSPLPPPAEAPCREAPSAAEPTLQPLLPALAAPLLPALAAPLLPALAAPLLPALAAPLLPGPQSLSTTVPAAGCHVASGCVGGGAIVLAASCGSTCKATGACVACVAVMPDEMNDRVGCCDAAGADGNEHGPVDAAQIL